MAFDHSAYLQALLATPVKRRLKILFDPVNGSAIEVGRQLFSRLGDLVMINDQSGVKPPRPSEPRAYTLKETSKQVVKHGCDLGIATDVDADRVLFIDETGAVLSEDLTAVILASGKKTLVTPVNSSGLFKAEAKKWGAQVTLCRVGPPEIIAAIKKHHADFAYEESGKYFFCDRFLWADGLLAGVEMLAALARRSPSEGGLSQLRKRYPIYYQVKLAIDCPWERMPQKFVGDGVKFEFPNNSFLFIRASGTEPLIRVFSDSPSQKRAKALADQGKKMVNDILNP